MKKRATSKVLPDYRSRKVDKDTVKFCAEKVMGWRLSHAKFSDVWVDKGQEDNPYAESHGFFWDPLEQDVHNFELVDKIGGGFKLTRFSKSGLWKAGFLVDGEWIWGRDEDRRRAIVKAALHAVRG